MRYSIINKFAPNIKEVELSEKELKYIQELAQGEERTDTMRRLNITKEEEESLYNKLGLNNKKRHRDVQAVVIAVENKLI
jgi:hypothetical protein